MVASHLVHLNPFVSYHFTLRILIFLFFRSFPPSGDVSTDSHTLRSNTSSSIALTSCTASPYCFVWQTHVQHLSANIVIIPTFHTTIPCHIDINCLTITTCPLFVTTSCRQHAFHFVSDLPLKNSCNANSRRQHSCACIVLRTSQMPLNHTSL